MVEKNPSERSEAYPRLGGVLTLAAGAGTIVALADLVLGRIQSPPSTMLAELLPNCTFAALLFSLVFLGSWCVLAPIGSSRKVPPAALVFGALGFCLGLMLDFGVVRGPQVLQSPMRVVIGVVPGLFIGIIGYQFGARWWRADGVGPIHLVVGAALLLAAALGLTFLSYSWMTVLAAWALFSVVALAVANGVAVGRAAGASAAVVWILFLALLAGHPFLGPSAREPAPTEGTSRGEHDVERVLLIVVDTLRADALSCASEDAPPTPNIDAFVAESYRFSDVRASGPWTLPSMASLLSPLVHRTSKRNWALPEEIPTLAERMSAAGYRTGAIGHNCVLSAIRRLDRGFEDYVFSFPAKTMRSAGYYLRLLFDPPPPTEHEDATELNVLAEQWIERNTDEDFFLWLHYCDPHLAYAPPAEFMPSGEPPHGLARSCEFVHLERIRGGYLQPTGDQREWIRALYAGEVRHFDAQFGALMQTLRDLDLYEDTLIVLTADHGEEFWEDEGFEHGHTVRDELLSVPLIVKLPGQTKRGVLETPLSLETVVPTILTLCGIEFAPEDLNVASALDAAGAPTAPMGDPLISTGSLYFQDRLSLVFDGWRYVRFLGTGEEELYDLAADPDEKWTRANSEPERMGVTGDSDTSLSVDEMDNLKAVGYAH